MVTQHYVGIAFRRGTPHDWHDLLVMQTTKGPFVHTEMFLQKDQASRFYTAVDSGARVHGITPTRRSLPLPANWEAVRFPVKPSGYKVAYALLLHLISLPIPYNNEDLWQCAMPLLLPFEKDLDCMDLPSWTTHGVFCSQMCMLVLKRLAILGVVHVSPKLMHGLHATNSRGCSPNALHKLILATPHPQKKETKDGETSGD